MKCLFFSLAFLVVLGIFFFYVTYTYEPLTGYVDSIFKDELDPKPGPDEKIELANDSELNYNDTSTGEKFIAYLPHSGFHSQRTSLENAIFLAWATNRTLVIPPIIFGARVPYQPVSALSTWLSQMGEEVIPDDCTKETGEKNETCVAKFNKNFHTLLKWDYLMDFTFIRENVRFIQRENFNKSELYNMLNITNTNQLYTQFDDSLYDFQIFDNPNTTTPLSPKFKRRLFLSQLKDHREKLLQLGSMFSSLRIITELPDDLKFFNSVRENMVIGNPKLLSAKEIITEQLGGLGSFVGVYIKIGGKNVTSTVANVTHQLLEEYAPKLIDPGSVKNTNGNNTGNPYDDSSDDAEDTVPRNVRRVLQSTSLMDDCQSRLTSSNYDYPIIYIATGSTNSTDSTHLKEAFAEIFSTFPCVYTLSDFDSYLNDVKAMRNPSDGAPLSSYFIPLVDLMVVASGQRFISTDRSAFSNYAIRLHQIWVGG